MKDPTVVAVPFYFGTMGLEYVWLRDKPDRAATPAVGYERPDTIASLTMGVGSLLAPFVLPRLLAPIVPGKGKYGKHLVAVAVGAAAVTTIADRLGRTPTGGGRIGRDTAPGGDAAGGDPAGSGAADGGTADGGSGRQRRHWRLIARRVAGAGGVVAVVAGSLSISTTWTTKTTMSRMWRRRVVPDLGSGAMAIVSAVLAWDFIYYWNHRIMHESRCLWAIHVVHHSSERYNLSTALRQPVADAFGAFIPYSLLALVGIRPEVINTARGINLLYQYWIHTETIGRLGKLETTLNTPSHHRVHHGSNGRYLDRNYGSILISWDKVFGSFEPESERVVYGLTKNIKSFSPWRIATHEYAEILRDVARSDNWRDRLSYVLRGPGWAARRREALAFGASVPAPRSGDPLHAEEAQPALA